MIRIELLSKDNFHPDSIDHYQRKQEVKKVYRKQDGEYILVDCVYTEDWDSGKRQSIAETISGDDYITYLALDEDKVVGFIGLLKQLFHSTHVHIEKSITLSFDLNSTYDESAGVRRRIYLFFIFIFCSFPGFFDCDTRAYVGSTAFYFLPC